MKTILFAVLLAWSAQLFAGCVVSGDLNWDDPCSQAKKKPRPNSFGDFNTPNSRMSEADMERDRKKELDRQTILDMQRRVEEDKRAEQAAIVRQQQARDQEIALRQQEIAAKNRQAAALEQAAASAEAARVAAIAAQHAAQNQKAAPPPAPRTMRCNLSNGWCD